MDSAANLSIQRQPMQLRLQCKTLYPTQDTMLYNFDRFGSTGNYISIDELFNSVTHKPEVAYYQIWLGCYQSHPLMVLLGFWLCYLQFQTATKWWLGTVVSPQMIFCLVVCDQIECMLLDAQGLLMFLYQIGFWKKNL